MSDDARTQRLARRYRRWLRAYPPDYRRRREPEMLATLLDAAGPGRTRPSAFEAFSLLRYGVGRRAAEVGRRAVVVAVVAAVLGGLSGIALGSWLAWRQVSPIAPRPAAAAEFARAVLPAPGRLQTGSYGRHTFWNPYSEHSLHGGTGVRAGRASVEAGPPPNADYRQIATAVQQRMRAQGWHDVRLALERNAPPSGAAEVTGTRDGYLAAVQISAADEVNPTTVTVNLMWAEPPGHLRATIAGGLGGSLLGALFGLLTSQRMRRHGPGRQRAYSALCLAALFLLAPACLANIPTATGSLLANTSRNGTGPSVFWGGFVIFGAEPLALLSLAPILAIVVTCLWPRLATARDTTTA